MDKAYIRQLVQAMAADDSGAFKQFFDLLYPRFYRLAFYYIQSDVLSEELVSDVFMKIWNNRHKLPEIEQLDLYFFRSVKNQALTYQKKEGRIPLADGHHLHSNRIEYNEPEKMLIARELAAAIEEAVCQLPDKCEMIFRLVREDGLSYKAAAELLDIAPKTVENQMHIALRKLRAALYAYQQNTTPSSHLLLWYTCLLLENFISP